ncbi:MAG: rhodanese-like domain-containing protein [Candidatus Micrarchaeota archaeon]|nr:rhodanese-like domain-containing protein [Candidatus Micrarchaeota archaeon]MCX8154408.1 rhodanese-like domain-containing protein [Candidatus Micrarchaeota archaeon]
MYIDHKIISVILISFLSGAIGGYIGSKLLSYNIYEQYYQMKSDIEVSPHSLLKRISIGDDSFILVDLRSAFEYRREHIVGAINIPAYINPNTSYYDNPDIIRQFRELKEKYPDKQIIVYCYSTPCKTGDKIGAILAKHGIYVKKLAVGWNEWRYFPKIFLHDVEYDIVNMSYFIHSGPDPGVYQGPVIDVCTAEMC